MRNDCLLRGAVALLSDASLSGPGNAFDFSAWRSSPGFSDAPFPQSIRLPAFSFSRSLISSCHHISQYCFAEHHGSFPGCGFVLREQTTTCWQSCSSTFRQAGVGFLRGRKRLGHFTLEMPGKDLNKSLPPNGRRPFEELFQMQQLGIPKGFNPFGCRRRI